MILCVQWKGNYRQKIDCGVECGVLFGREKIKLLTHCCISLCSKLGPTGGHQYRALGLGQRPFLDAPFTGHLRELEPYRRKVPTSSANQLPSAPTAASMGPSGSHSSSSSNGLPSSSSTIDCQDHYKPNAPQIHGKSIFSPAFLKRKNKKKLELFSTATLSNS